MKILTLTALTFLGAICVSAAPFENLNFELAQTETIPNGGFAPVTDLLPGWELYHTGPDSVLLPGYELLKTGDRFDSIAFNNFGASSRSYATLVDSTYIDSGLILEGQFSLYFYDALEPHWLLRQNGDIPLDAQVLNYTYFGLAFGVTINGEDVFPRDNNLLPTFGTPATKSFDVSAYAGQTVDLTFHTTGAIPVGDSEFGSMLDSITFTVPEPSTYALLVLGVAVLGGRWLWQRRRRSSG